MKKIVARPQNIGKPLDERRYEKALNEAQYSAVTSTEGHLLIVAGAGTGKTRVITYRTAYLIESGYQPRNILLLTFTRRAANEMLHRTQQLAQRDCSKVQGGTFHSYAHLMLRRYGKYIHLPPNFTVLDQGDSVDGVKLARDSVLRNKDGSFIPARTVQGIISSARNKRISISDAAIEENPRFDVYIDDIEKIAKVYENLKRKNILVDFDDLLDHFHTLLLEPYGTRIASQCIQVQVDEYQDTNVVQGEIAALLAKHHGNLAVVGDDAQCIYVWRGSHIENILNFPDSYSNTKIVKLEQNYRSVQPILNTANAVMSGAANTYTKVLRATREGTRRPVIWEMDDEGSQAELIVKEILRLLDHNVPITEIAVLARAVSHLRTIEISLAHANIPYVVYGGIRLLEAAHIKDMMSYVRVAANPKDELALKRMLEMLPRIGGATSAKLIDDILDAPNPTVVMRAPPRYVPASAVTGLVAAAEVLVDIRKNRRDPYACIGSVLDFYLPIMEGRLDRYDSRKEDLDRVLEMSRRYKHVSVLLADLVLDPNNDKKALVQRDDEDGNEPTDTEVLVLSTVHSAKGLEFDSVFVPNVVEGKFPTVRSILSADPSHLEEERRLMYVAVTRAKNRLYICVPRYVNQGGATSTSRFIDARVKAHMDVQSFVTQAYGQHNKSERKLYW